MYCTFFCLMYLDLLLYFRYILIIIYINEPFSPPYFPFLALNVLSGHLRTGRSYHQTGRINPFFWPIEVYIQTSRRRFFCEFWVEFMTSFGFSCLETVGPSTQTFHNDCNSFYDGVVLLLWLGESRIRFGVDRSHPFAFFSSFLFIYPSFPCFSFLFLFI